LLDDQEGLTLPGIPHDEQDRTLLVKATVSKPLAGCGRGIAEAEILMATDQQTIFAPVSAVANFAGIEKILTVQGSVSAEILVNTGRRMGIGWKSSA